MTRRWLPENVTEYRDRHGKKRYRFRKQGFPQYSFRSAPGTPEFMAEYHNATRAIAEKPERHAPYSYDALIASYYRTPEWLGMKPSSQRTYRGIIERFRADNGSVDVRTVKTSSVIAKLAAMKETPAAANNLRKALGRLHTFAVTLDWCENSPITATKPYKSGKGWHCWTEAEIDLFDARWPFGTKERLAKELLLESASREADATLIGKQHRHGDELHLHHSKNDSATIIPIGPDLSHAMATFDSGHMTYLTTEFGKPYTPKGFYNWFKRACVKAGVPHCHPHGLRKAASRRLAESGATSFQGRAVTGHKSDRVFAYYAESADKRGLAQEGMANVHRRFAKTKPET